MEGRCKVLLQSIEARSPDVWQRMPATSPFSTMLTSEQINAVRTCATRLLARMKASYLSCELVSNDEDERLQLRFFDAFFQPLHVTTRGTDRDASGLRYELEQLLELLLESWPPNAHPVRLGVMTDGSGMCFCPELPSPAGEGWAGRVLSGEVRSLHLLPFARTSPWSLLTMAGDSGSMN